MSFSRQEALAFYSDAPPTPADPPKKGAKEAPIAGFFSGERQVDRMHVKIYHTIRTNMD